MVHWLQWLFPHMSALPLGSCCCRCYSAAHSDSDVISSQVCDDVRWPSVTSAAALLFNLFTPGRSCDSRPARCAVNAFPNICVTDAQFIINAHFASFTSSLKHPWFDRRFLSVQMGSANIKVASYSQLKGCDLGGLEFVVSPSIRSLKLVK